MHAMSVGVSLILFVLILYVRCYRKDPQYWEELAKNELAEALEVKLNTNTAKNVIVFIGDGMGPNTVTATRIYKGGESHRMSFEKFPHVGLLKTYSADKMVPDSACSSTALLCGQKANQGTIGVSSAVEAKDCTASLENENRLESLAVHALRAGKSAGFVTTMRVTHATPSPLYAHSAYRSWECEANMPAGTQNCKDIARQLVEDWPGRDLHVILGGGRQTLVSNSTGTEQDPISAWSCYRQDGKNLIETYKKDKEDRGLKYTYVSNTGQLRNFDNDSDYLLGIFSNAHLDYEHDRNNGPEGMPSITDMVEVAIKVLKRNPNGYFLMVEGGNIDMGHHRGRAKTAINEAATMEEAVQVALNMTDERDTLMIVTSDHTHTLSINGYPKRGSSIFGTLGPSQFDGVNYTTLSYGTGGPGSFQYDIKDDDNNKSKMVRRDPSLEDTTNPLYEQIAGIPLEENSHGGGDVVVYAKGPYAHLFHNVHEQHYLYHAVAYAAKLGPHSGGDVYRVNITVFIAIALVFLLFR